MQSVFFTLASVKFFNNFFPSTAKKKKKREFLYSGFMCNLNFFKTQRELTEYRSHPRNDSLRFLKPKLSYRISEKGLN